jgi:hypothetical protein
MPVTKQEAVEGTPDNEGPRRPVKKPTKYRVRRVTEDGSDPSVFAHEDKNVARRYVETNHPRGREVYVHHPDGYREHFSDEHKFQGSDNGGWTELTEDDFDG